MGFHISAYGPGPTSFRSHGLHNFVITPGPHMLDLFIFFSVWLNVSMKYLSSEKMLISWKRFYLLIYISLGETLSTLLCGQVLESATNITMHVVHGHVSSRFSKNSEADASEYLRNLKQYYLLDVVINISLSQYPVCKGTLHMNSDSA